MSSRTLPGPFLHPSPSSNRDSSRDEEGGDGRHAHFDNGTVRYDWDLSADERGELRGSVGAGVRGAGGDVYVAAELDETTGRLAAEATGSGHIGRGVTLRGSAAGDIYDEEGFNPGLDHAEMGAHYLLDAETMVDAVVGNDDARGTYAGGEYERRGSEVDRARTSVSYSERDGLRGDYRGDHRGETWETHETVTVRGGDVSGTLSGVGSTRLGAVDLEGRGAVDSRGDWRASGSATSPESGANLRASAGGTVHNGEAHALDQINRLEGVKGRRFRVRICDTQGGWVLGATDKVKALATYLIDSDEKIQAIISGASSDTTAIQTVTKPAGILLLSISATAISLTHEEGEQLTWRMVSSDWFQGTALGEVARSCHQAVAPGSDAGVAVLGVTNIYGNSMWQVLQRLPLSTSQFRYYPVEIDHNNLDSMLTTIKKNGHSVIIVVGSTDMAARVFHHYKTSSGQRPIIFLTDSNKNQEFLQLVDSSVSLERVYGTIPGAAESTNTYKTFELTFNALEGVEPAQGSYTAHSYDAIYSLVLAHAHALAQGSSVRGTDLVQGLGALNGDTDDVASFTTDFTQIRSTLLDGGVVNVEGASGPLAFDQFGDLPSQVELWTVAEEMDSDRRFDSLGWIAVTKNGHKDFSINNPSVFAAICANH